MDEEKKWMLMTYYCPTHGDSGMIKPIEITKKELCKKFHKKDSTSINYNNDGLLKESKLEHKVLDIQV